MQSLEFPHRYRCISGKCSCGLGTVHADGDRKQFSTAVGDQLERNSTYNHLCERDDPSDNIAVRDLALAEMSGKASATHLMQKMESIRGQIHMARTARSERAKQVGTINTPEDVNAMIDTAIEQGKQQARTQ